MSSSPIKTTILKTWGGRDVNITTPATRQLLQAQVLKGVVKNPAKGINPDLVSAPLMAKEAGIDSEISTLVPGKAIKHTQYWNLINVEVTRVDGTTSTMSGVVMGSDPHIVRVDEFTDIFAFQPKGSHILTYKNPDEPGVLSKVLDVLAGANINIARLVRLCV